MGFCLLLTPRPAFAGCMPAQAHRGGPFESGACGSLAPLADAGLHGHASESTACRCSMIQLAAGRTGMPLRGQNMYASGSDLGSIYGVVSHNNS